MKAPADNGSEVKQGDTRCANPAFRALRSSPPRRQTLVVVAIPTDSSIPKIRRRCDSCHWVPIVSCQRSKNPGNAVNTRSQSLRAASEFPSLAKQAAAMSGDAQPHGTP